jgi:hypothetical protein
MKKVLIAIILALFSVTAIGTSTTPALSAYAQKKDDKKKDPPGPPIVRDKGPRGDDRPKDRPKKDKKPDLL